eukprot:CAMPEP_0197671636 /NCGR_PEP_ID=MMETSP1338-20131121/77067_1 /TAXON_ID=43686 ORGANISM="Pelagodinium beii, Strain RCC1491" /NCGR_SAMPLE_ID=MMETSP1338 /ASSEMBLY_ACC=CAM_ASM_000754 /LENGTH=453 /DNA_ID=CAMNT_0043251569 /DNA_START=37 /DNA_END=1395 /DNA_ORIENTATION=+
MGAGLERQNPVTDKESDGQDATGPLCLAWASSAMQGWRLGMEDAHICLPAMPRSSALFGVLDGHGGEQVAKFCERHLPEAIMDEWQRRVPKTATQTEATQELESALIAAFHKMDDMLREPRRAAELRSLTNPPSRRADSSMPPFSSDRNVDPHNVGCTACVCCITENQIVVANAGDSRAVLCRNGKAQPLSQDHKPNDDREKHRIQAAGGYVEQTAPGQFRVNGNLNLSRALGDLEYKKDRKRKPEEQIICGTPDVYFFDRDTEADEFLVICCDGIWDVKTNQEVVDFLRERLPKPDDPVDPEDMKLALEQLMDSCVSPDLRKTMGLGGDNMTAVIVMLRSAPKILHTRLLADDGRTETLSEVADAKTGWLEVDVALPGQKSVLDISAGLSEDSAQLEVVFATKTGSGGHTSQEFVSRVFDLQSKLPEGAVFRLSKEPARLTSSGKLRISIPW